MITKEQLAAANDFINGTRALNFKLEFDGDLIELGDTYTKEELNAILVCKQWDVEEVQPKAQYPRFTATRPWGSDTYTVNDNSTITFNGLFSLLSIRKIMKEAGMMDNTMPTDPWITRQQAAEADLVLEASDEPGHYIDIEAFNNPKQVKLDGWFTLDELEAIILLKKYDNQQKGL